MVRMMKDSGIGWIGEIPDDWGFARIGSLYTLRNTKVSDTDYPPLSVTNKGIVPQLETAAKTNAHDDRKLVRKGDFAINSRSDRRGSCGISKYDGSVSLINTILAPNGEMNPQYYDWLFHTVQFADEFYKWGHGIVDDLWTTGWQDMKRIVIPLPSVAEQERIASFLDEKCTEIDALMADVQTQIETLEQYKRSVITETVTKGLDPNVPMKDSGIEWLGQIPYTWSISRIKYVADFMPTCTKTGLTGESEIEYAPMECIKNGYYVRRVALLNTVPSSLTPFNEGDIVMAKVTPCFENGNIAIMSNIESGYGLGSSELFVLRAYTIARKYLFYWLRNTIFMERAASTMTGMGGLKRVSASFIQNDSITVPPALEQQAIASYLDAKCAEIDAIIDGKRQQLAVLDEYKKSLIFEYVTGKKEVP